MNKIKPIGISPCCDYKMRFEYQPDSVGDLCVRTRCRKCGEFGRWYNIPFCDDVFWKDSAFEFASLDWSGKFVLR